MIHDLPAASGNICDNLDQPVGRFEYGLERWDVWIRVTVGSKRLSCDIPINDFINEMPLKERILAAINDLVEQLT